jgi:hypothetical protein
MGSCTWAFCMEGMGTTMRMRIPSHGHHDKGPKEGSKGGQLGV